MENHFHRFTIDGRAGCGNVVVSIIINSVDYCFYFPEWVTLDRGTVVLAVRSKPMDRRNSIKLILASTEQKKVLSTVQYFLPRER